MNQSRIIPELAGLLHLRTRISPLYARFLGDNP
jgi:hypothetical protein